MDWSLAFPRFYQWLLLLLRSLYLKSLAFIYLFHTRVNVLRSCFIIDNWQHLSMSSVNNQQLVKFTSKITQMIFSSRYAQLTSIFSELGDLKLVGDFHSRPIVEGDSCLGHAGQLSISLTLHSSPFHHSTFRPSQLHQSWSQLLLRDSQLPSHLTPEPLSPTCTMNPWCMLSYIRNLLIYFSEIPWIGTFFSSISTLTTSISLSLFQWNQELKVCLHTANPGFGWWVWQNRDMQRRMDQLEKTAEHLTNVITPCPLAFSVFESLTSVGLF